MKALTSLLIFVNALFFTGCHPAVQNPVKIENARREDITGIFTLVLYGKSHANDIETVAILDIEGDGFTFSPDAPEYYYKIRKGIPAREALQDAIEFVNWHRAFHRVQISRIVDSRGAVLGYEVRPLYDPLAFGVFDVLDIGYRLTDSTVMVDVKLIYIVERQLHNDGGFKMFRW